MGVKKATKIADFEALYDCIVSGQVSPDRIAEYLKDKSFYKYWRKRNEMLALQNGTDLGRRP